MALTMPSTPAVWDQLMVLSVLIFKSMPYFSRSLLVWKRDEVIVLLVIARVYDIYMRRAGLNAHVKNHTYDNDAIPVDSEGED